MIYYIATIIKSVWDWWRDKYWAPWTRREIPEIDPREYTQLIFDKGPTAIQWRKSSFSNNGAGANSHPLRKINFKWKMNLDVKSKTMKLLEKT